MKLRNKKTGEIVDLSEGFIRDTYSGNMIQIKQVAISNKEGYVYDSLSKLNDDWEDYEEPKGIIKVAKGVVPTFVYIEYATKEEAEKAVEKLKAWKRLKDKGFRFDGWDENHHNLGIIEFSFSDVEKSVYDFVNDLDLLFGGEE